jgi:hypothetical protein
LTHFSWPGEPLSKSHWAYDPKLLILKLTKLFIWVQKNAEIWLRQAVTDRCSDLSLLCFTILAFGGLFFISILMA